jgi:cell wall-associated NlpC family hydrolase
MPAMLLKGVLGGLLPDAVRLLAGLVLGLLVCLLVALQVIPAVLLTGHTPGEAVSPGEAPPAPAHLAAIFAEVEGFTGIPASLLTAIAFIESGFDPAARGPLIERFAGTEDAHALGLMQFLPSTYRQLAPRVDALTGVRLGELGLWHPRHAIFAAALYLQDHGAPADLRRALFAYNHDTTYVDRVLALAARYARPVPGGDVAARALAYARTQLGTPYRWGGADERGFDCSGLTRWAYAATGVHLPRTAETQLYATQRLTRDQLQPGDLVFFQICCQPPDTITHVGIYAGNGRMIHAPAEGTVVREEAIDTPYWRQHWAGAGRVLPASTGDGR